MSDQYYSATPSWFPLVAHKVAARTYDLSSGLNYVSVKDQVVRACALIDSLNVAGMLPNPYRSTNIDYDLIVVGAGAAGVSAAWRAGKLGARTLVVEKGEGPFPLQRSCTHRHISFSMYDWPETFATAGPFPSLGDEPVSCGDPAKNEDSGFPCVSDSWKPKFASELVREWDAQLAKFPISCDWKFETKAEPKLFNQGSLGQDPGFVAVTLTREAGTGGIEDIKACNVVIATGIGIERDLPGSSYQPVSFWRDDARVPWAVKGNADGLRVVVSGSGDGAIQDVLKSLLSVEDGNLISVAEALFPRTKLAGVKARIQAIERHAERQLLWGVSDDAVYKGTQAAYQAIVSGISVKSLRSWKKKYVSDQPKPYVEWVMTRARVFTKTYPLNRLLATVLAHEEFGAYVSFREGMLERVIESHDGSPWICTLDSGADLTSHYPPMLRHGIESSAANAYSNDDLKALRTAISRAPVPFKPFDF